ncbi:MAG: hypothetical protein FWE24_02725 [Defluviitaleaceae bacterium]|nr:hypothetical protein [Defluviitaleaceae bacterium]
MNISNRVLWITRTGIMIALLIVSQAVTAPMGNQFITGSLVNLMLFVSTMMFGLPSGLAVAIISPFFASLFGIGPAFPIIIPFIGLGNAALVVVWHFIANNRDNIVYRVIGVIAGAVAKFAVLYVGIVMVVAPLILELPPQAPIYVMFSFPQLITALIGGAIALVIYPILKKAVGEKRD